MLLALEQAATGPLNPTCTKWFGDPFVIRLGVLTPPLNFVDVFGSVRYEYFEIPSS